MPRNARERSGSGVYHVVLRGINKQDIFNDAEDRLRLIEALEKYKTICEYHLYGYCLMTNHIHILIKEGKETISQIMKRIGTSYVYWYNNKYERYGPLFQDRYKSEPVEDDKYLLVVLRYIHQNPTRAGMVQRLEDYSWSSYGDYIKQKNTLVDIDYILNIYSENAADGLNAFTRFTNEYIKDDAAKVHIDYEVNIRRSMKDEEVRRIIKEIVKNDNPQIIQQFDKNERDGILKALKEEGLSIRQLARITGIGRKIIEKA